MHKKPKKIRKPRAKKNKEQIQQTEITTETRENVAPSRCGARKNRLLKYFAAFAMVCIMLIINTDKVNGKNNSSKREKIRSEILQERNKAVYLYHNNSNKAVVLNQSKMTTENKVIELSADVKKAIKKNPYYSADEFIKDSLTYAEAIKEGRMLCIVKSVAKSGMSRVLAFHSLEGEERKYYRSYRSFFMALGYSESRSREGFIVSGCGMDMTFNTNYTIINRFGSMGIISIDEAKVLCQKTPTNL